MLWVWVCWIALTPLNLEVNAYWDGDHQLDEQQIYILSCWMRNPEVCG